eukprot:TRINITY_DN9560_c2_g1_i1.p1 TRINITY_DN9560_c2_g1~~TRINITY_DN9560_c2_g1_i1.p1  ORF type:complete len:374 (-),score=84.01 TRINITY_DN9560_c2_g1_i1:170-1291(-)
MATKGLGSKKGAAQGQWEQSDFPIVCETCLGENPYLRMTKEPFGKECKVCNRPFTVFRWRPGPKARFKKTEICMTCAQLKNVCQTCLLDLQFNLPVQVRDEAVEEPDMIPQSDVHREYFADQAQKKLAAGEVTWGKAEPSHMLSKLARHTPYYKRNLPHICSFFVKGTCNRGAQCPYRHEMPPPESEMSKQNIKDRYYGVNDPVAKKMLERAKDKKISAPEDQTITTIYLGGINGLVSEQDIRGVFYSYGELQSINVVPASKCAFVEYTTRESAEAAINGVGATVQINGQNLRVSWGRSSGNRQPRDVTAGAYNHGFGAPSAGFFNMPVAPPPSAMGAAQPQQFYPSMNPGAMGSKPEELSKGGKSSTSSRHQ